MDYIIEPQIPSWCTFVHYEILKISSSGFGQGHLSKPHTHSQHYPRQSWFKRFEDTHFGNTSVGRSFWTKFIRKKTIGTFYLGDRAHRHLIATISFAFCQTCSWPLCQPPSSSWSPSSLPLWWPSQWRLLSSQACQPLHEHVFRVRYTLELLTYNSLGLLLEKYFSWKLFLLYFRRRRMKVWKSLQK